MDNEKKTSNGNPRYFQNPRKHYTLVLLSPMRVSQCERIKKEMFGQILFMFFASALSSTSSSTSTSTSTPLTSIHVDSGHFVDEHGRVRLFHGINSVIKGFPWWAIGRDLFKSLYKFFATLSVAVQTIPSIIKFT